MYTFKNINTKWKDQNKRALLLDANKNTNTYVLIGLNLINESLRQRIFKP